MSMNIDKIVSAAAEEGYEVAHTQESYGEHLFGLVILVKMSERKLDLRNRDGITFIRAANDIKKGLEKVSAEIDPKGPEQRARYRKEIEDIYAAAGVTTIYLEELPNGYSDDAFFLNRPWFRVTSSIGHVVIGWRKSVISIDWKDSTVKTISNEIFHGEDVTKYEHLIHAHGRTKATEYVRRLHEASR